MTKDRNGNGNGNGPQDGPDVNDDGFVSQAYVIPGDKPKLMTLEQRAEDERLKAQSDEIERRVALETHEFCVVPPFIGFKAYNYKTKACDYKVWIRIDEIAHISLRKIASDPLDETEYTLVRTTVETIFYTKVSHLTLLKIICAETQPPQFHIHTS